MTPKPPITLADIPPDWHLVVREAMNQREGVPVRACPTAPSLEVWSINRRMWGPLMLPGGSTVFATVEDRDAVLRRIQGA